MTYRQRLCVAGLPFEIAVRPALAHFFDIYFKGYQTEDAPGFTIFVENKAAPSGKIRRGRVVPELTAASPGNWNIMNNDKDRMVIGAIDERMRTCELRSFVCSDSYLLSCAVRVCVQFFLERSGGFFLHAACGNIGGKGILFTGKSTAGKSTGLHNLRPDSVVAEDAAAIRLARGKARIFAIPFRGERPSCAALTAIVFPRKWTGAPRLTRAAPAAAAAEIAANALYCGPSSETLMSRVLPAIVECSRAVPAFECRFDKSTDLFPIFRDHGIFD